MGKGRGRPRWLLAFAIALGVVAITVVALFVTSPHGQPNQFCDAEAPCAVSFSWGMPVNNSGSVSVGCPSAMGHYCYSVDLAGNQSLQYLTLSLRSSVGSTIGWPAPAVDVLSLVSPGGTILASYRTINSTWTADADSAAFGEDNSLVIYTPGVGPDYGLKGESILAEVSGPDGISFTTPSAAFP